MTYYLRNWLSSQLGSVETPSVPQAPTVVPPPAENEDDDEDDVKTVRGDDDDAPPAFPSLNSAQRAAEPSSLPTILNDSSLMPPPPLPVLAARRPGVSSSSNMLGVPASGGSLMPPPSTTKAPSKKASRKVALAPGHGPLDWANLKKSGVDLRGVDGLMRVTPSMLKEHNKKDDAWSAFNGKVYNITAYLPYHPGGEKELIRVAGRDGTKLFSLTHAWVNVDYMLDECLVGFLVPES